MPSFKMSSALATEENATTPPSNAILEPGRSAFVWFLIRAVIWTKVLPHQMIA
jgi:hypothetical protein